MCFENIQSVYLVLPFVAYLRRAIGYNFIIHTALIYNEVGKESMSFT